MEDIISDLPLGNLNHISKQEQKNTETHQEQFTKQNSQNTMW